MAYRTLARRVQCLEVRTGHRDGVAYVVMRETTVTIQRWGGATESMPAAEFARRYSGDHIDGQVYKVYIATDEFDPDAA